MRIVLFLAVLAVWVVEAVAWPQLPARVPTHFDAAGRPDGWVAKSAWWWFAMPALATVLGALLGWLLPRWVIALARANSPWLNVPDKRRFHALPVEARVRAVSAPAASLPLLAVTLQLLIGWIVFGSARVAAGDWATLPSVPSFVLLGCCW